MKNLYAKLHKVQTDMRAVAKDMDNPYYKSKYFDVNTVIAELKPLLAKHGLLVLQPLTMKDGVQAISTIVADPESGESAEWCTPLPQNPDPQKQGGLMTYYRRYALTSLLLIQGEDDDDANAASGKKIDVAKSTETDPFSKPLKTCPSCGKSHSGQYQKCLDCYRKSKQ